MKALRYASLIFGVLLAHVALAASNSGIPFVTNTTLLKATPSYTYAQTNVTRLGYAIPGDVASLTYFVGYGGTATFSGNPSNNDTLTINGSTITFVTATAGANQVHIAGTLASTLTNLSAFLIPPQTGPLGAATYYISSSVLHILAREPVALTLAKSSSAITLSGVALTQGGTGCTNSSGAGDNGAQIPSQDSKCWVASWPAGNRDTQQFGADASGKTASDTAIAACLASLPNGGWCTTGGQGRLLLNSALVIPGEVGYDGGAVFGDTADASPYLNSQPALMTVSANGVAAVNSGGAGAAIKNIMIFPSGMTFPQANPAGTWVSGSLGLVDGGGGQFTVENVMVVGYDTSARFDGGRDHISRLYLDGLGSSNGTLYILNGNTDAGEFREIKLEPFATGNTGEGGATCSSSSRPGIGWLNNGENFINGSIFIFNYVTIGMDNLYELDADKINTDNGEVACGSTYAGTIGIKLDTGSQLHATQASINGGGIGLQLLDGTQGLVNTIGSLWLNEINGDCIVVGSAPSPATVAGSLLIGNLDTNQASASGPIANCTKYLVHWFDGTGESVLELSNTDVRGINTGSYSSYTSAQPFFYISPPTEVVTFSNGVATITKSGHGLSINQAITFTTTGALPTNFATSTIYYIVSVPTANTFTVSATQGGSAIVAGSAGSGTQTLHTGITQEPVMGRHQNLQVDNIITDLNPTAILYGTAFLAGAGSEKMLAGVESNSVVCTGLGGTPGACSLAGTGSGYNYDLSDGYFVIEAGGSGLAATGTITMTFPYTAQYTWVCEFTYSQGTAWNAPSPLQSVNSGGGVNTIEVIWAQTGNLTSGVVYAISYGSCHAK